MSHLKDRKDKELLIITQVYVPDPASVGQHMADVADEMVERGWSVTVITADRGYDEPGEQFLRREMLNGVDVQRLRWSSLGKKTILHRLVGQISFSLQALGRALVMKRPDAILVTTSPPMGGVVGWLASSLRQVPLTFWTMDLNPDQAVEQGLVSERNLLVRVFDWFNRRLLRRAAAVVALDRFMAERLERKAPIGNRLHIMPPWPMEGQIERVEHDANPFRREHGLEGKFVVMYSGNHSPVHPLDTILEASRAFRDNDRVRFLFIGGGKGKDAVEDFIAQEEPPNVISLPYQPLDQIKYSLSAADIHLVSMGEAMVGCVHPCKFYGALALGKPILALGSARSHIGDILAEHQVGWRIDHQDVDGAVRLLQQCLSAEADELRAPGATGRQLIKERLSKDILCGRFCDTIESTCTAHA